MIFSRKRKLLLFYADKYQYKNNCFIAQLGETLRRNFEVQLVSYNELMNDLKKVPKFDIALSVLKQRSWVSAVNKLEKFMDGRPIYFYDQDPWEAYHDEASSPGSYKMIAEKLNVKSFLVTSKWWANYINNTDGLPTDFVRMGMLPRLCSVGKPFLKREIEIGFQGTLHKHRKRFFQRMEKMGLEIEFLPSDSYEKFLINLNNIGIYLHDEQADVFINGVPSLNGIWVKEIEAAARGAFAIRNYEAESQAYGIDELPIVMPFRQEGDVPNIIENIRSMPEKERNDRIHESVNRIKERNDWMTVVNAISHEL